jgi:hypothetical protein
MALNAEYQKLIDQPPKLEVLANAREVIFTVIACMCDNKYTLRLRKNSNGDFKLNGMGFSLKNFQFKYEPYEIEWEADVENWNKVFAMINSGTSTIREIRSR